MSPGVCVRPAGSLRLAAGRGARWRPFSGSTRLSVTERSWRMRGGVGGLLKVAGSDSLPFPARRGSFPNEEGERKKCCSESWDPLELVNKRPPLERDAGPGRGLPWAPLSPPPPPPHRSRVPKRCPPEAFSLAAAGPGGKHSCALVRAPTTVKRPPERRAPQHPPGPPG